MKRYILDENNNAVEVTSLDEWKAWSDQNPRHRLVGQDEIGPCTISTIFHGITDDDDVDLHVWETRIFGGALDQVTERCAGNREQAEAMHARLVNRVRNLKT